MSSASTSTARATAADPRRRTILFADDDPSIRKLASLALRALGYDAILAADGDEALAAIADHGDEIACVLMDLTMPGIDGVATTRRIRELEPALPVVLVSGRQPADLGHRADRSLFAGYLQKPFTPDALGDAVGQVLATA